MTDPATSGTTGDDATWPDQRDAQVEAWLATTPAQRLAWLEEAIAFAHRVGALPRQRDPQGGPR